MTRRVYFETGEGWVDTPIYPRANWNAVVKGPAVVEQYDATTVIYPGWAAETDDFGNMLLRRTRR